MNLAFRVARADGTPAHRVRDELRASRLQKFRGSGQALIQYAEQSLARQQQALLDVVAAVDIRIVDQALPPDGGTWLFEVHAHDDKQLLAELILQRSQSMSIVKRRLRVMNRARANDDQQPVILTVQTCTNFVARIGDNLLSLIGQRKFGKYLSRRGQRLKLQHPAVDDAADTYLVLPARHVRGDERVLALSHGLTNRAKLLRRIQRLRADLQRVRGHGAAILLLHNISPWIIIFPKDRVSREQTQIVSDGARGES